MPKRLEENCTWQSDRLIKKPRDVQTYTIIDLRTRGIDEAQAADLRARLATFAEDWNSPEMDIYDNYDAAKANL